MLGFNSQVQQSWQKRGSNEDTNDLINQYFSKTTESSLGSVYKTLRSKGRAPSGHDTAKTTSGFTDKDELFIHKKLLQNFLQRLPPAPDRVRTGVSARVHCQKFSHNDGSATYPTPLKLFPP